ncbi:hypothetical protein [Actibacterium sp. MT2.3-13A]|uniref:hypothetical protein n=1 Tax=Actibacterium sp. MT2.3-13A TaxID=2828332 RepID=UPI001BA6E6B3|nr:hypothetical protein [Actibacterium sp. MT2.3-13A]
MQNLKLGAAALALALLAACGTTDSERALSGAVMGAVVADVLDESVAAGAAVGAAGGALCDDAGVCR